MLTKTAKQQLMKAGWYEGRKIDVSHFEKRFTELGYEFFPAARSFLEEFGDLYIKDKYWSISVKNSVTVNESSTELKEFHYMLPDKDDELDNDFEDFSKNVGKKIIPAAKIDFGNVALYISEDGKFYAYPNDFCDGGLWAENSDQLWNEYYGEEERGFASWEDIKAGKGRIMRKNMKRGRIYL